MVLSERTVEIMTFLCKCSESDFRWKDFILFQLLLMLASQNTHPLIQPFDTPLINWITVYKHFTTIIKDKKMVFKQFCIISFEWQSDSFTQKRHIVSTARSP